MRAIFRGTAHHVIVVIICLHVFSTLHQFLQRSRRFAYIMAINLISLTSFFLRIISKFGNSFYLAEFFPQPLITLQSFLSCSVLFYSLSLFRRYCKYKSIIKKHDLISIRPKEAQCVIPPVFVRPSVMSCPLFNSWTAWRVSKKLGTHEQAVRDDVQSLWFGRLSSRSRSVAVKGYVTYFVSAL